MADMEQLLGAINAAEQNAYGADTDGALSYERSISIDMYLGKDLWPVPEGRSKVVDRSVYETIQWILPSLCRIFAGNGEVVSLPPVGPEDEAAAKQETEYLNWLVTQKNDWFNIVSEWMTDALMTKNAYCLARRESRIMSELESYEKQTAEGLALLLQDDVQITSQKSYPDPDYKPEPQVDPQTGQQVIPPPTQLYDVTIRRSQTDKTIKLYVLPPERVKVDHKTPSWKLNEANYFEWWEECTISSLRQQGFEVEDDVGGGDDRETLEGTSRDIYGESQDDSAVDPSMRLVKARFVWIRHDYDEDGIAEMQYCVVIGSDIIFREECSRIPVACIVPNPMPHRHIGLSITDTVGELQAVKTVLLRQGLDNLYMSNNPQKVVNENVVNLDDAMISRPGAIVRVNGSADPSNYRHEVPPFVFPQVLQGMEYMDQIRENRTGTNRYFTGIDQNAMNKTATGINQLTTMAAQRVEHIARIFASGVEDLFSIVHELVLKSGHKKEVIKLRNNWTEVDPAQWRRRTDFRIAVGFAAGNKDAMINRLTMIAANQAQAMQLGLSIVTDQNMYETQLELVKAADFATPERFWTDPQGAPPKQPQPDPSLQIKQMEIQSAEKIEAARIAAEQRANAEKLMLGKYQTDTESETKLKIAGATLQDNQQARIDDVHGKAHLIKAQVDADPENRDLLAKESDNMNSEQVLQVLQTIQESQAQQQQTFTDALSQLAKAIAAPRVAIRDKTGKIAGSQPVIS